MRNIKKRITAVLLCICLLTGMLSGLGMTALAAESTFPVVFWDADIKWESGTWETNEGAVIARGSYTTSYQRLIDSINRTLTGGAADIPRSMITNNGTLELPDGYQLSTTKSAVTLAKGTVIVYVEKIKVTYPVTVAAAPEAGGTVTGAGTYDEDAQVAVQASAAAQYHFVRWTEDGAEVSTAPRYTFQATAARNLVAEFEACTWGQWEGNHNGTHSRKCVVCEAEQTENCTGGSPTCIAKAVCEKCGEEYGSFSVHDYGELIAEVPATEETKGVAAHYQCADCGALFDEDKQPATEQTLCLARLPRKVWTLKFVDAKTGAEVLGGAPVIEVPDNIAERMSKNDSLWNGAMIDIPLSRLEFDVSGIPEDYRLATDQYGTSAAIFSKDAVIIKVEKITYTIEISAAPDGRGSVTGGGVYEIKSEAVLTASPADGCHFVRWTEDGAEVSTDATYRFTVTKDRNLVAVFERCDWTDWKSNGDSTHSRECKICHTPQTGNCTGGSASCTEPAICEICKSGYGDGLGHDFAGDFDAWDAEGHWHICNRTGCAVTDEPQPHQFTDYKYNDDATCLKDGTETAVCDCAGCKAEDTRTAEGSRHGHTMTHHPKADATCVAAGNVEYWHCAECGKDYDSEAGGNVIDDVVIPIDPNNHQLAHHEAKAATCTEVGWEAYDTCGRDGCDYTTYKEIPAKGHRYVHHDKVPATHEKDGTAEHYTCEACDALFDRDKKAATAEQLVLDKLGHTFAQAWKTNAAQHWHECDCGKRSDEGKHSFVWVTDKKPTETKAGSKHEECKVCGYKKAPVAIPATGKTDSPHTGDDTNLTFWIVLLCVSCCGAVGAVILGRRKRTQTGTN